MDALLLRGRTRGDGLDQTFRSHNKNPQDTAIKPYMYFIKRGCKSSPNLAPRLLMSLSRGREGERALKLLTHAIISAERGGGQSVVPLRAGV